MLRNILRTSRFLARRQINRPTATAIYHSPIRNAVNLYVLSSRLFSASSQEVSSNIDTLTYDKICTETLESLYEYFEELIDQSSNLKGADITFSDGVLTIALGSNYGTYVINRQSPNKQIWLSSPTSEPKRYDLVLENGGYWVYRHDGKTLHQLLQTEISKIVNNADFRNCSHSLV